MYGSEPIPGQAGGTINRARFIKLSTAADQTFLQSGANEQPLVGISDVAPVAAPVDGADATIIADTSRPDFMYHPEGNITLLEIGTGGITRGAYLKSDTDGTGIALSASSKQYVGALALESASQGELARVLVKLMQLDNS